MSASPTFPGKMRQHKPSSTCYPVHMTDFLNWASTEASFASTARSLARTRLSRARSSSSRCKSFRSTSPSEFALYDVITSGNIKVRDWQCSNECNASYRVVALTVPPSCNHRAILGRERRSDVEALLSGFSSTNVVNIHFEDDPEKRRCNTHVDVQKAVNNLPQLKRVLHWKQECCRTL
jgi:hypothetical protein